MGQGRWEGKHAMLDSSLSYLGLSPHIKVRGIEALPVSWVFSENYPRSQRRRGFEDTGTPEI